MSKHTPERRPVVLCILDGWGIGDGGEYDAVAQADTPCYDSLMQKYPNSRLVTYGPAVGLPEGQFGNSEVGHDAIGLGRVREQNLERISKALEAGDVEKNEKLQTFISELKSTTNTCHLMGLASDGGVHAHIDHIIGMTKILDAAGITVKIHAFTDGRDTAPQCADEQIKVLQERCDELKNTSIVTVSGRYYAMDRDNRWDRVSQAFNAIAHGESGTTATTALEAVEKAYDDGKTDEFILPTVVGDYYGVQPGEGILFANFRADRAREILQALKYKIFEGFDRGSYDPSVHPALGMIPYSEELDKYMDALFPPVETPNHLAEVISKAGKTQAHFAETEKYPHVTFFFNGRVEEQYPGEDRKVSDSPKKDADGNDAPTYDLVPEMAAMDVKNNVMEALQSGSYDFILVNFANPDMVGHTGDLEAVKTACATVDMALSEIVAKVLEQGGQIIVTADHGNAEQMFDPEENGPHTAHTLNPVPCILVSNQACEKLNDGTLTDLAPTILELIGLEQPSEMTGASLTIK